MRTLIILLVACLLTSYSAYNRKKITESFLSIEQDFYVLGMYQGTAHKVFKINLQDSVIRVDTTSWKLSFVREVYKESDEEKMEQYSSTDRKGNDVTIRMYYEGTLLTDISFSRLYTSCHFYIIKSYQL